MLVVLSPARKFDFETPPHVERHGQPEFLADAGRLVTRLRELDAAGLASLLSISDPLAALNLARYACWRAPFSLQDARQAALAFDGTVYGGLDARSLDPAQLDWAQAHLRIVSGLYGILRPLDLIQPYRLEMGTRLVTDRGRDLYAFWRGRLSKAIDAELARHRRPVLVNLASAEYFKVLEPASLRHEVVQPVFQEWRAGAWRVISVAAKRARGRMARYSIEHRVDDPHGLKGFDLDGYRFIPEASSAATWVFRREG